MFRLCYSSYFKIFFVLVAEVIRFYIKVPIKEFRVFCLEWLIATHGVCLELVMLLALDK